MRNLHGEIWHTPVFHLGVHICVSKDFVDFTLNLGWVHISVYWKSEEYVCPCCEDEK